MKNIPWIGMLPSSAQRQITTVLRKPIHLVLIETLRELIPTRGGGEAGGITFVGYIFVEIIIFI